MPPMRAFRCRGSFLRRPRPLELALAVAICSATACDDPNVGVTPPRDGLFFPTGVLLDPRTPPDEPARFLFVSNGNNDLSYSSSSVVAIDLDLFFAAWSGEDGSVFPYCERDAQGRVVAGSGRCVLPPASETSERFPCRRLALLPQVVECDEAPFVVSSARVGNFATMLASSREPDGTHRLWVPVRGEPSITFIDIVGSPGETPQLRCGQDDSPGRSGRCARAHRLTHLRNDEDLEALSREPYNIVVHETESFRHAYVAHSAGSMLTLVDLDGLTSADDRPAIVDMTGLFNFSQAIPGGFGLAPRPCSPEDDNVPSVTRGCTRPLVYGGFRYEPFITTFTTTKLDPSELGTVAGARDGCYVNTDEGRVYGGPYCASPDELGQPCAVSCEPSVDLTARFYSGGLAGSTTTRLPMLGDLAFGDERGDVLYALQTNPGALLQIDTSLDFDFEPANVASASPIEVCDQPNRMKIWNGHAYITCFGSAFIYVVDLRGARVIDAIVAGTGPHDLVVDPVRQMLYAVNTLENSISVVDLRATSPNRNREIARIGLQEPFEQ